MAKSKEEKISLFDRIKQNTTIKETAIITESKILKGMEIVSTPIPMLNVALSGSLDGGFSSGLIQFAGPSKHFKTLFCLILAKAYLEKYPEAYLLLYISEFGQPMTYFEILSIDKSRVILSPVVDVEQLKIELINQIEKFERGDKVMIMIDSIGNLASRKETEDALKENAVADMTRAKALKSLFRMIGIRLTLKDIPMVIVNHTYSSMEMYSKQVVGGGCLIKDTLIQTYNGLVKIQDIQIGDYVKTLDGLKEVSDVWNPNTLYEGYPECYEIEFDDGYKVIVSEDHKFINEGIWKNILELNIGDEVSVL